MIKLVTFLKRGPQLTRPAFEERWKTIHAPMAAIFPALRGYMLGFSLDEEEPAADGVAQLWFDNREGAQASYASEIGRKGSADASAYLSRREHLLASELWLAKTAPLSSTPYKVMIGVKRAAGVTRVAFMRLFDGLGNDLRKASGLDQIRVSLDEKGQLLNSKVQGSLDLTEGEAVFDALIEAWSADLPEARAARNNLKTWASRALQLHVSKIEDALLMEHVVVMPPAPAYGLELTK